MPIRGRTGLETNPRKELPRSNEALGELESGNQATSETGRARRTPRQPGIHGSAEDLLQLWPPTRRNCAPPRILRGEKLPSPSQAALGPSDCTLVSIGLHAKVALAYLENSWISLDNTKWSIAEATMASLLEKMRKRKVWRHKEKRGSQVSTVDGLPSRTQPDERTTNAVEVKVRSCFLSLFQHESAHPT